MPNRIPRLPRAVKTAPKQQKQSAAQGLVDDMLRSLGQAVDAEDGQKRVTAVYNPTGRFWFLRAAKPEDDPICKQVLAQIQATVKAEKAAEAAAAPPAQPASEAPATPLGGAPDAGQPSPAGNPPPAGNPIGTNQPPGL
jgi:hypothetical protein